MSEEQIASLNQIAAIIDEKATKYKNEVFAMPEVRAFAEKKLILDLIDDGLNLAQALSPRPLDLIGDLKRLQSQLQNMA